MGPPDGTLNGREVLNIQSSESAFSVQFLRELVEEGAALDIRGEEDENLLDVALIYDAEAAAEYLVEQGLALIAKRSLIFSDCCFE
ncbi:MAG: hypothetical protein ACLFR1_03315 [Spirochaetia bacterium]